MVKRTVSVRDRDDAARRRRNKKQRRAFEEDTYALPPVVERHRSSPGQYSQKAAAWPTGPGLHPAKRLHGHGLVAQRRRRSGRGAG